jgi:hypothetical protein
MEQFSLDRARMIVESLRPRHVVAIGLKTFDLLVTGEPVLRGERGSVLAKRGDLWGCPATGVIHLSGSRISRGDRDRIAAFFSAQISN